MATNEIDPIFLYREKLFLHYILSPIPNAEFPIKAYVPVESREPTTRMVMAQAISIFVAVAASSWRWDDDLTSLVPTALPTITYYYDTSNVVVVDGRQDCDDDEDHERASKDTRATFQCSAPFKIHGLGPWTLESLDSALQTGEHEVLQQTN